MLNQIQTLTIKSPDFIRLHAHSINFKNQLLYQVFSFSTEISFHKKSPNFKYIQKILLIVTIQRKSEEHEHMSLIFSLISMNGCYKKNSKLSIPGPNVAYNHPNPFLNLKVLLSSLNACTLGVYF